MSITNIEEHKKYFCLHKKRVCGVLKKVSEELNNAGIELQKVRK